MIHSLGKGRHSLLASKLKDTNEHDPLGNERALISSLLEVFRRPIPERWFSIRFWAMDTIRNMVGHRPGKALVGILVEEGASEAFKSLFAPTYITVDGVSIPNSPLHGHRSAGTSPRGSTFSKSSHGGRSLNSNTPTNARSGPDGDGKLRAKLMEEYRREASKRAEELVMYISIWDKVGPGEDDMENAKGNLKRRLEVVSIAGIGGGF